MSVLTEPVFLLPICSCSLATLSPVICSEMFILLTHRPELLTTEHSAQYTASYLVRVAQQIH